MNKCAVALSSYNGEKFIAEQLDSLVFQTRLPDRIYISDDGSSDKTVEVIQRYINTYPEIQWVFTQNKRNIGWQKNFFELISSVEEEIIFLCDQDDVWERNKIELMVDVLARQPEVELLACGYHAWYMDEESHISSKFTQGINGTGRVYQIPMNAKFMHVLRPGCTYCFRRSFFQDIVPYWLEGKDHDAVLWRYSIVRGTGYLYDLPLIKWRRYRNSSSSKYYGIDKENAATIRYRAVIESYESNIRFLPQMIKYCKDHMAGTKEERLICCTMRYLEEYYQALKKESLMGLIKTGIRYRQYFLSWKTPLADMLMAICRRKKDESTKRDIK